jgi:argininosuccinate lyase
VKEALERNLVPQEIDISLINQVAVALIGHELRLTVEELKRALDPVHFVESRVLPGGPGSSEMQRALGVRQSQQQELESWLRERQEQHRKTFAHLDAVITSWNA